MTVNLSTFLWQRTYTNEHKIAVFDQLLLFNAPLRRTRVNSRYGRTVGPY